MSLNFKTANLNSSTYPILTKEQISSVLSPVSMVLTEEGIVEPSDTGTVVESASPEAPPEVIVVEVEVTSTGSAAPVIIDNVPYITKNNTASRGPWGEISVGELMAEIIRDFEEGTYAGGPEGIRGGKLAFEIDSGDFNSDDTLEI